MPACKEEFRTANAGACHRSAVNSVVRSVFLSTSLRAMDPLICIPRFPTSPHGNASFSSMLASPTAGAARTVILAVVGAIDPYLANGALPADRDARHTCGAQAEVRFAVGAGLLIILQLIVTKTA